MSYPIYFVSLGPGDPELITLKSLRALQQAEIIFCPSTLNRNGEVLSRAARLLCEWELENRIRLFNLPMRKDRTEAKAVYDEVLRQIITEHEAGKRIAVAVEGDAGIYASIHYVLDELIKRQVATQQLCGIPSFIAAGAVAQLQLISQEERLVVIPGTVTQEELDHYVVTNHVPVIMKLSSCISTMHAYMKLHPEYIYHYFENVSADHAYYSCDKAELEEKTFPYFSLMIITKSL